MKIDKTICFFMHGIHRVAIGTNDAAGGAERQVWFMAQALASRGIDVICCDYQTPAFPPQTINQVRFFHGGQRHYISALVYCQQRLKFDICYFRGANHSLGPAVMYLKARKIPSIYGIAFDDDCIPSRALARRRYLWPAYAMGLNRCYRIFAQHRGQMSLLPSRLQRRACLVPSIAGEISSRRQPLEGYIAWVGMLRTPKRPDRLIALAQKCPDLLFVVAGGVTLHRSATGYGEKILSQLQELENVDYRGLVSPNEAEEIIARSAVLLSTSEREGFPNVFLQAWRNRVPVASWEIDPGGVIKREGIGIFAPDLEQMCRELSMLLSCFDKNREMGERGAEYVLKHHTSEIASAAFIESLT